jgi:hypothetical protein
LGSIIPFMRTGRSALRDRYTLRSDIGRTPRAVPQSYMPLRETETQSNSSRLRIW